MKIFLIIDKNIWTASSEFGTYRLWEQRRFRRACASAQARQNLRCSLIQAVSQEEPSDRKPDPWTLWMAGHAQLKFVMKECLKTQIRLTRSICCGYSLELSHWGDSEFPQLSILKNMFWAFIRIAEYPQHMFLWRTEENDLLIIIKYPPYLFNC